MASPAYGSLDFAEQIQFFRQKIDLPTRHWTDLWQEAHDRAFVVAGAMQADLLADLHTAALKGIAEGTTLATFRKDFKEIVARTGWTGWTGEGTAAGRAWRTRVIYETNLRTSYAAGRWAQIQEVKPNRPYLLYRHNDNVLTPRPLHQSWNGKILAADDPWWQTHYPPNGWGCQCTAFAVDEEYLRRQGKAGPDQAPDDGTYDWQNPKTGEWVRDIPNGIDPGWAYSPGASLSLDDFVAGKVAKLPGGLGKALATDVATNVRPPIEAAAQAARDDCLAWGRVNNRERLILLDEATGNELSRLDGSAHAVSFNQATTDLLQDKTKSIRLIHNHPSDNSLSEADFGTLTLPGVNGIEAAGHGGSRYSAFSISKNLSNEDLYRAIEAVDKAIRLEIQPSLDVMRMPLDIANWAHHYLMGKSLDAAGFVRYEAILTQEKMTQLEPYKWLVDRCIASAKREVENIPW